MTTAMTPREFAQRHLGEFTEKNGEIIPKLCPYCHGGQHHDKGTFAMKADSGVFVCLRGSCGERGTFYKLKRDFGEADKTRHFGDLGKAVKKPFKPSTAPLYPPGRTVREYLEMRKISGATMDRYQIGDDGKGNICFPYIREGQRVAVKYRPARKLEPGEQKMFRETGTDTTSLFGMQLVDTRQRRLVITEGEIDCLSLAEVGVINPVSVPNGSQDFNFIQANWEWLEQFEEITICGDTDEAGWVMTRQLVQRLGAYRCTIARLPEDVKDANETLHRHNAQTLLKAVAGAQEVPVAGMLRLADVEPLDLSTTERFKTGVYDLDTATGGLFFGQTTVVTGSNGCGKSTFVGQMLLEGIEQGYAVCAFSGELPAPVFRHWIDLQAAGADRVHYRHDPLFDLEKPYVTYSDAQKISQWYRDKFFLYDNATVMTPESVFAVFEYVARRYNCRIFLVDNLMMLIGGNDGEYYHRQSEFIKQCAAFAKRFDVHMLICAHPRKVMGRIAKMDVSGTADITNLADNVIALYRLTADEKKGSGSGDAILDVFKCRFSGQQDVHVGLCFDDRCKRFYQRSSRFLLERVYGWRKNNDGSDNLPNDEKENDHEQNSELHVRGF